LHLEHSFSVPVSIEEAWDVLLDIERVGPCMPGASIDSVEGDNFTGTVKVKLGPINLTYKGHASFVEKDAAARRAVIDARGRDSRGNGTAAAVVTATLADAGDSTNVDVHTELDITGKPAQFGRGVMVDVGNKLIGQFADALANTLQSGETAVPKAAAAAPAAAAPAAAAPAAAGEAAPGAPPAPRKAGRPKPTPAAPAAEAPEVAVPEVVSVPAAEEQEEEPAATVGSGQPAGHTVPAYGAPGGIPDSVGSVNGREPRPAQPEVEPIDLLQHAGPALAKRLAPIAVALVVLVVALRRRRRHR
jgi:carbon monoxide dehydrogenase subunit G